jgi:dUTP pyrophosphatase
MTKDSQHKERVVVRIKRVRGAPDIPLPEYQSKGAAGVDLRACLEEPVVIEPGRTVLVPTGFSVALPDGYEAQIRPRSGMALRDAISVPNSPGTIDSDYRGEVQIILINHGEEPFTVEHGMRIAQMVVTPVVQAVWEESDELPSTKRGAGGFGSTGH